MIQVDALSMAYQGHPLFTQAVFSIQPGERCGLVGRNGSGKTTLFRLLTGKETPDQGNISFRKNYLIGTLEQHISFSQQTLLQEAALGLRPEEKDCLYKAEKILFGLGFSEEDMEKNPQDFSGGYQLRIHLAKVLISEPDCLLLDEPTNYLDIVSTRWFARFLQKWRGEFILISHDREFMDSVTTHTMGIHRQKVRKIKGNTIDFYEQILQEEEIYEKTRVNIEKKRSHAQSYIDRFGAKASKASQAQSKKKMLDRIPILEKLKGIEELDFNFKEAPFHSKKMLDAIDVSFSYFPEEAPQLIDKLSLAIENGERIAIIGKNGRGKSTILKLLSDELSPNSGHVKCSENVSMGYFGQTNIDRLHPRHTVEEEIASANRSLNITQVKGICGLMMFSGDKASKLTSVLSGGEKSRVLLGKILATPCNMLLLDEPTHHLDMESIEALIDALEEFEGAVLIVTHSELILKRMALDKIVVCRENAQEVFLGSYGDFLESGGWGDEVDATKPKKKEQRDDRQLKAEMVNERSRALKPIENDMAKVETQIMKLESEQEVENQKLVQIAGGSDSKKIQELSKAIGIRKETIDRLYDQLELLTQKKENLSQEFSKKLDQFQKENIK